MNHDRKQTALTTALCLLPVPVGVLLYPRLPAQVPINFALDGTPSGWAGRAFAVFGLPCIMAAMNLFLHCALHRDPRQGSMSTVLKAIALWLVPVLTAVCSGLSLGCALGYSVHAEAVIPGLVGILFLLLGNYLPKTKQNSTMGIRLPWTLSSEENWNRTHRLTGFLWAICGLLFLLFSLLRLWSTALLTVFLLPMILLPIVYSWYLARKGV